MLGITAAFLSNIFLARLLTPADLGVYYIIFSLAMFLSIIARFGMRQTALRISGELFGDGNVGAIASLADRVLAVVLIGNFAIAAVYAPAYLFLGFTESSLALLPFLALWVFSLSVLVPVAEILRGAGRPRTGALLDAPLFNLMAFMVFGAWLFFQREASVVQAISAANVLSLACLITGLVVLRTYRGKVDRSGSKVGPDTGQLLRISSPILVVNLTTFLLGNAGLWIVGYLASAQDAGVYGVAIRLFNLMALPLLVINMAIEPKIITLRSKGDHHQLNLLLQSSAALALGVSGAAVLAMALVGHWLVPTAFGEGYAHAYHYLMILAVANLVNVWTGSAINYLLISGSERAVMVVNSVAVVLTLPILSLLTVEYGVAGTAWGTAIAISAQQLAFWQLSRRKGVNTHPIYSFKQAFLTLTRKDSAASKDR